MLVSQNKQSHTGLEQHENDRTVPLSNTNTISIKFDILLFMQ